MYCTKCGKEMDYDATVCRECQQAETAEVLTPIIESIDPAPRRNPRMRGFGKALASAIVGFVGMYCAVFFYIFGMVGIGIHAESGAPLGTSIVSTIVLELISLIPAVIALVFGIRSIKVFRATPADQPKPIPTLVLGIVGVASAGFALFYAGIVIFIISMLGLGLVT
ncbi:MAG: hypothetical protein E7644_08070 [Ruminococcaceae bacterium]|nr:hypothetical protein [Oscillospiraceae bacterium]